MDRTKVAVLGAGFIADIHLESYHRFVPEAEVVAVSAKTGEGLDELRAALARAADAAPSRDVQGAARLYVDRVFTLRGIGTVVTGTLWSGTVTEGDTLRIAGVPAILGAPDLLEGGLRGKRRHRRAAIGHGTSPDSISKARSTIGPDRLASMVLGALRPDGQPSVGWEAGGKSGRYSAIASPEPPNSLGKSLSLGRPSFMGSTVSA